MRSICLNFEINHIEFISNNINDEIDSQSIELSKKLVESYYSKINNVLAEISNEFGSLFKYSISISNESIAFYKEHFPAFIDELKELNKRSISFPLCVSSLSDITNINKFNTEIQEHKNSVNSILSFETTDVLFASNLFTKNLFDKVYRSKIKAIWASTIVNKQYVNKLIGIDDVEGVELLQSDNELCAMFIDDKYKLSDIINKLNDKSADTQLVNLSFNYSDFIDNDTILDKLRSFPEQLMSESNFTFSSLSEIINYAESEFIPKYVNTLPESISNLEGINKDSLLLISKFESINNDIHKCKEIERSKLWNYLNSTSSIANLNNKVFDKQFIGNNCDFDSQKQFSMQIKNLYLQLSSNIDDCLENDNLKNAQYRFTDLENMPKVKLKKLFSGVDAKTILYSIQNQSAMLKDRVLSNIPYRVLDEIEELIAVDNDFDKVEIRNARRRILSKLKKI
ncbi:MAG: hypothetical protein B6I18_04900 [Bacteroidetes bacterium 4572_112]|nr:MAG: hypothetical protein B6I18_04900 [Bacteroidetes bacterium 4572_112]